MAKLITVPTFTFDQGDVFEEGEYPIQVSYYRDGIIELSQGGQEFDIREQDLQKLFKEIKKHLPEAKKELGE